MKYRNIIIIALILMCCPMLFAAQLKDTTITGNGTVTGNLKVTGTATVTNLKDLSVVTTTTNPNINVGTGVISTSGIETIVTFNTVGTTTFTPPSGVTEVKVLVVAGGGGGGSGIAGGGGAGGLIASTLSVTGTVTVTVGAGGAGGAAGASNNGVNGSNSVFSSLTAIGGGAGGAATNNAGNGGSGGGARTGTAGTGTTNQGFGGGVASATNGTAGGGGGAGAIGNTAVGSASGAGGVGVSSNITGTTTFYAGGGGGGGYVQGPTTAGAGGNGGGGAGGVGAVGTAGTNNKGGGGGGGGYDNVAPTNYAGGAGGSGVVIVRFITTYATITANDKFRLDNNGRVVVGGTVANSSLTVINDGINGVGIDLRSDDTNLTNINNFSVARLLADFTSTSYADSRLYLQTATGDNAWKTGLIIKDGKAGIGTSTPATELHVVGTVTATSFSGNGAGLTGKENTLSNSAGLASAISDETGTNTVVYSSGSTQTNPTFTGNINLPSGIWNNSGNVGIGTGTPADKLTQTGNIRMRSADSRIIGLNDDGAYVLGASGGAAMRFIIDNANDEIAFETHKTGISHAERMRITSTGNVGIGTPAPTDPLTVRKDLAGDQANTLRLENLTAAQAYSGSDIVFIANRTTGGATEYANIRGLINNIGDATYSSELIFNTAVSGALGERMRINNAGNVGIGVTAPNNILTLPIASATDPIADAWTLHCLADYKNMGTETAEMIQNSANEKVKTVPVSVFTKKAIITDDEAERKVKQKYQDKIKESAKADLELYTAETGVAVNDNSYVTELLESMWETKSDRLTIVETNKQKLIAEKKALPKFQRKNYGIVAEDAPPEAQVLREDGSLQGVDTSVLIGILWANAQKQEERISALEIEITSLKQRLQTAGIP